MCHNIIAYGVRVHTSPPLEGMYVRAMRRTVASVRRTLSNSTMSRAPASSSGITRRVAPDRFATCGGTVSLVAPTKQYLVETQHRLPESAGLGG